MNFLFQVTKDFKKGRNIVRSFHLRKNTLAAESKVGEEKLDRELFPAVRVRDDGARILVVAMEGKRGEPKLLYIRNRTLEMDVI